jgi:RNA polymerase sigma-70 factor, ECF subfamily
MIAQAIFLPEAGVGAEAEARQLRSGNMDALAALIARYQNRLYRYLLRLVRQPAEAEDLFQQTWVRVAEKIHQFNPQRNFDAWLFTLARNLAFDHLRRIRPASLNEPLEPDGAAAIDFLLSRERPAVDAIIASERSALLTEALEEMPMIFREVLTLRFEEEMKLEEIAQVMGTPLSTVKSRLRRGLETARRHLETRCPGENWQ